MSRHFGAAAYGGETVESKD